MDIVGSLRALIGEDGVIDAAEVSTRAVGVGRTERMSAAALARPKTTDEVAAVLRWCNANGV